MSLLRLLPTLQMHLWKIGSLQISHLCSQKQKKYHAFYDTITRVAVAIFAVLAAYDFFCPCLPFVASCLLQGALLTWITLLACSLLLKVLHQHLKPPASRNLLSAFEAAAKPVSTNET